MISWQKMSCLSQPRGQNLAQEEALWNCVSGQWKISGYWLTQASRWKCALTFGEHPNFSFLISAVLLQLKLQLKSLACECLQPSPWSPFYSFCANIPISNNKGINQDAYTVSLECYLPTISWLLCSNDPISIFPLAYFPQFTTMLKFFF